MENMLGLFRCGHYNEVALLHEVTAKWGFTVLQMIILSKYYQMSYWYNIVYYLLVLVLIRYFHGTRVFWLLVFAL